MERQLLQMYTGYEDWSDPKFYPKAYADYLEKKNESYRAISDAISDADYYVSISEEESSDNLYRSIANQVCTERSLNPKAAIPLESGYVALEDLLFAVAKDGDSSTSNEITINCFTSKLNLKANVSVVDAVRQLQDQLLSTDAWAAAIRCSDYNDQASRLAAFTESLNNIYGDVANFSCSAVDYCKKMLTAAESGISMINTMFNLGNMDKQADDDEDTTVGDCDLSKYTGASPAGPLNFDNAISTMSSIVKVGCKVTKAVVSAGLNLLKKGFNKVFKTIKETVADPDDLEYLDSSECNNCISTFKYTASYSDEKPSPFIFTSYYHSSSVENPTDYPVSDFVSQLYGASVRAKSPDPVYHLDLNSCCTSRYNGTVRAGGYVASNSFNGFSFQFAGDDKGITEFNAAPRIINPKVALSYIKARTANTDYDDDHWNFTAVYAPVIARMMRNDPSLYDTKNLSEIDKAYGLYLSLVFGFLNSAGVLGSYQLVDGGSTQYIPLFKYDKRNDHPITNLGFAELAGAVETPTTFWGQEVINSLQTVYKYVFRYESTVKLPLIGLLPCFAVEYLTILQNADQYNFPQDFLFVPYSKNAESLGVDTWRIKTDSENYEAFNSFATTAIIVAAAIGVGIVGRAKIKDIQYKKAAKRQYKLDALNNRINAGEYLSPSDRRLYSKLSKKGGVRELLNKGTIGQFATTNSPSAGVTSTDVSKMLDSSVESIVESVSSDLTSIKNMLNGLDLKTITDSLSSLQDELTRLKEIVIS